MAIKLSSTFKLVTYSYVNQAITMVLQLVQLKLLTHFLPVDNYGAWNQIIVAVSFLVIMLNLNLGHGFIRFASAYSTEKKQKTYNSVLIFQTVLTLIVITVLLPFRYTITKFLTDYESNTIYFLIGWLALITISIDSIQRFLLVSGKEVQMIKQNLIKIISDVCFTVVGVIIRHDIFGALAGYSISKLFCLVLFSRINNINYRKLTFSTEIITPLLKFSLPLIPISIAYWVINSSNRYLIKYFIDLEAVGLFAVANRFPMMLIIIFTLLSTIFLSNVSRLFDSGNYERVSYWFSIFIRIFFFVGIAGGTMLIAANRPLTLIVSNKNYLFEGLPLVYLFISIGSLAFGGFQILSRLYDLEKKVYQNSINWIVAMVLNVVLNILLIPIWGIVGAGIATGTTFFISFVIAIIRRPKKIQLNVSWLKLFLYALISFTLAFTFASNEKTAELSIFSGLLYSCLLGIGSLLFGLAMKIINIHELISLIKR